MLPSRPTKLFFEGRTGNQLFQLFAGLHYKSRNEIRFIVNANDLENFKAEFTNLNLPEFEWTVEPKLRFYKAIFRRIRSAALRRSRSLRLVYLRILKSYFASETGYDAKFERLSVLREIRGYFQTFRYLPEYLSHEGLAIREPSSNFINYQKQMIDRNPIAVHIRGGDYRNLKELFGILAPEYYINALNHFSHLDEASDIWVFTNDRKLTMEIFRAVPNQITFIVDEQSISAAESLVLMSHARKIIISNSTFSWWGAYLRQSNKIIVAPEKWFKNLEDPKDLIPKNWMRIGSEWLN